MRDLVVLFIHFIATLARLLGPGGARSMVAESLLLKYQLLILNRSRQRSPNLSAWDRILAGWMALFIRVGRRHSDLRIHSTLTRTSSTSATQAWPGTQEVGVFRWQMDCGNRD
jgi:hypothetical protein